MEENNAIQIENAKVLLKGEEILHDINWSVKNGSKYFILGANGSGKTTLVRTVLGYIPAKYGANISVLGKTFGRVNLHSLRSEIAWVSPFLQKTIQHCTTGVDVILSGMYGMLGFFRKATQEELDKVEELLRFMNGLELANKDFHEMSSGEQMKILIARALISKPKLMIFDEPSVYLDIAQREFVLNLIEKIAKEQKDMTMIFISQRIEDILPVFDEGMILKDGKILCEGDRESVLTPANLKLAFGVDIELIKTESGRLWSVIK